MTCESCKFYFPIYWKIVELKEGHRDAAFKIQGSERTRLIQIKTLIPHASQIKSPKNWCSFFGANKKMQVSTQGDCKQHKERGLE